eukprot:2721651-Prymnesium_polylepis.1
MAHHTSLLGKEPRGHCPPFSGTTPHVIEKKHIPACVSRRAANDERVAVFANLPRGLVHGSRTPSSQRFGRTATRAFDSAPSTYSGSRAADRSSSACISVPDCTRTMTSPAQFFRKAALRAAMFAQ